MAKERKVWIIHGSCSDCIIEEGILLRKARSECRVKIDNPKVERSCWNKKEDDHIYYVSTKDCAFSEEEIKEVIKNKIELDLVFWEYTLEEAKEEVKRIEKELKKVESPKYDPLKKKNKTL